MIYNTCWCSSPCRIAKQGYVFLMRETRIEPLLHGNRNQCALVISSISIGEYIIYGNSHVLTTLLILEITGVVFNTV